MRKNKIKILLVLTLAIVVTSACGYEKIKKTKVKDMDYTVVAENEMPKEVKEIIEKRKDRLHTATMNIHILLLGTVDNSTRAIL